MVQPPSCSEQLSTVQAILSSHTVAVPLHLPALHVSGPLQVKPSLQLEPSALAGLLHVPVFTSHVPTVWQLSAAVHTTWPTGVHTPLWQASPVVQGLTSLHFTPSCLVGLEQMPVAAA